MCLRQTCRLDQEKGRVTIQSNSSKPRARLALPDASEMGSLDVQVRHVSDQREVNSKSRDTPATMDDCAAALLNQVFRVWVSNVILACVLVSMSCFLACEDVCSLHSPPLP